MGLDITAYSRLEYVGAHEINPENNEGETGPWCYNDDHIQAVAYDAFPQSFRGIPELSKLTVGTDAFLFGGCFKLTEQTQIHGFRAGSYMGYGMWRDDLRRQFNPNTEPDNPFYELIWFADNEGCIGALAAAELLADFRANKDAYVPIADWAREKYEDWTRAFELAADGGLVNFH